VRTKDGKIKDVQFSVRSRSVCKLNKKSASSSLCLHTFVSAMAVLGLFRGDEKSLPDLTRTPGTMLQATSDCAWLI
jgi:hypothetical protein